jgi:hypothetical protein
VTRVTGADGAAAELPESRVTPLRLWVAPGRHQAEIVFGGGAVASCRVDVVEGGTHLCHVTRAEPAPSTADYWKEMGWWR